MGFLDKYRSGNETRNGSPVGRSEGDKLGTERIGNRTAAARSEQSGSGRGIDKDSGSAFTRTVQSAEHVESPPSHLRLVNEPKPVDVKFSGFQFDADEADVVKPRATGRPRGRPPGSKNRPKDGSAQVVDKTNLIQETLSGFSDMLPEPWKLTNTEVEYNARWLNRAAQETLPPGLNHVVNAISGEGMIGLVFAAGIGVGGYLARRWEYLKPDDKSRTGDVRPERPSGTRTESGRAIAHNPPPRIDDVNPTTSGTPGDENLSDSDNRLEGAVVDDAVRNFIDSITGFATV